MNKAEVVSNNEEDDRDTNQFDASPAPFSIPQQVLYEGGGTLLDVSFAKRQSPKKMELWSYTLPSGSTIVAWRGTPPDRKKTPQENDAVEEMGENRGEKTAQFAEALFAIENGRFVCTTVTDALHYMRVGRESFLNGDFERLPVTKLELQRALSNRSRILGIVRQRDSLSTKTSPAVRNLLQDMTQHPLYKALPWEAINEIAKRELGIDDACTMVNINPQDLPPFPPPLEKPPQTINSATIFEADSLPIKKEEIDESARDRRIRIAEVLFTIKNGRFPTVADTTASFFNIHIPSKADYPEGYKLAKLRITRQSNEVYAIRRQIGEFLLLDAPEKRKGPKWLQAVDNAVQHHPVLGQLTDDEQVGILWGEKSLTELCEQTGLSYTEVTDSPLQITDPQIEHK